MLADVDAPTGPPDAAPPPAGRGAVEVRVLFPSDPLAVRSALGGVLRGLDFLRLSPDMRGTLELVLAEALNNVVEHAHGGRSDGVIEVRVSHDGSGSVPTLCCELIDDGAPMPDGAPPRTEPPEIDGADITLPEGGFGWLLIRQLARDLDYARLDGRNRLRFVIDVVLEPQSD